MFIYIHSKNYASKFFKTIYNLKQKQYVVATKRGAGPFAGGKSSRTGRKLGRSSWRPFLSDVLGRDPCGRHGVGAAAMALRRAENNEGGGDDASTRVDLDHLWKEGEGEAKGDNGAKARKGRWRLKKA